MSPSVENIGRALACAIAFAVCSSPSGAQAGVEMRAQPEPTASAAPGRAETPARGTDASVLSGRKADPRRPTLRCFQEGRLVYEGSGLVPVSRSSSSFDFRLAGSSGVAVQVLDLRNALCLVETGHAP